MKNLLKTITLILLVSFSSIAQKGDKQYSDLAYIDAIKTYEKVAAKGYKSVDLFQKLGNSYYFNAKLKEANKWYTELFAMGEQVDPEYYYRYAQTLKAVEDYTNADKYLEKFNVASGNDARAIIFNKQKNYKEVIARNSGRYQIRNVDINTKSSDYGSAFYKDQVIFATSRDSIGVVRIKNKWTNGAFLNLYVADKSPEGMLTSAKKFSGNVNSKFHEDSPIFTKDQKTMYFTRNNFTNGKIGKDKESVILLKLYRATLEGNSWRNVVEIPFNSEVYSVAHPALSPDDKTLYFASNMPGTKGQSDIFKVDITGDNIYSAPVNLTGDLNTEGRETFPYITEDNELYFASDGHQGLGGLDVFVTKLNSEGNPGEIVNIGSPINGPLDDFAFLIDKSNSSGYFSSNRQGGKGLDDIYSFRETKKIEVKAECLQELIGVITNSDTGLILSNAKVTLFDDKFNQLTTMQSDENGNYNFPVLCGKKYFVRGEKDEYETKEAPIVIPNESGKCKLPLATAKKIKEIKIGTDLAKTLDIPMIYFDLDKSFIRKDAALQLAKVLLVMNENPTMVVDVRSHTDSRQTFNYNEALSDRRAKSTVAWLIKNGISADRLTGRGYGEIQLVNNCADNVECTEEEHQLNRRSEFIVVKL